jgi:hypothetical protein
MKFLLTVAVLCLLAAPAPAIIVDLETAVDDVGDKCSSWKDTLEADGLDKAEAKVAKFCGKAADLAAAYTGALDKKGVKPVSKAIAAVEKALKAAEKSGLAEDADVTAALATVKDVLAAMLSSSRSDATSRIGDLISEKNIAKLKKAIDKAVATADKASALWSEKYGKAAKTFLKSFFGYAKSMDLADKLMAAEIKKGLVDPGFSIENGVITLDPGETLTIKDICWNLKITVAGNTTTESGCLSSTNPGALPIDIPAGSVWDGSAFFPTIPGGIPGFPVKVKGSFTYKTSKGDFKFAWSLN